ncbi:hypothetical protein HYR99_06645 [Candidatus Poribacteria bacterium]|nr:hypothetical protein [Candidatus Poribacteria bacterium]
MTKKKVILAFESMEQREKCIAEMKFVVSQKYKRNPWVVIEASDEELNELERQGAIKIHHDIQFQYLPGGGTGVPIEEIR